MVRLLRPAKENFIAGFGEQAGSWTELALHDSEDKVYVPTVGFEVACFTTNERMIAFSGRTGTFDTLALRPGEQATPIVGYAVACFSTNERCVAFSADTGRFDSVELKGEVAVPSIGMRTCTLFVGSMWYEFSAKAGRWSGVDVGEPIGPQQVLPGNLGGPGAIGGGGLGGGGFGGGGGFFSVGPEGGSAAVSSGAGGASDQTPIPFGGGGAVVDEAVEASAAQQPANPLNARRFEGGGGALGEGFTASDNAGGSGALAEDAVADAAPEQPAWKPGFVNRLWTQAGMVFLMADGRRLAGYSSRTGQWCQFEFRDHEVVTNATSGLSLVTIVTSQRLIGFSFEAGLFDAIDVPPEHAPIDPQNMIDYSWATIGSRVATFSAKTGRWTVLELGEHPQGKPAAFLDLQ